MLLNVSRIGAHRLIGTKGRTCSLPYARDPGVTPVIASAPELLSNITVSGCAGGSCHGAEGQNRTADTVIFSHVLYQLSYLGTVERR